MKKLELLNFGVVEMDDWEMQETDGGRFPWMKVIELIATFGEDAYNGLKDGWNGK